LNEQAIENGGRPENRTLSPLRVVLFSRQWGTIADCLPWFPTKDSDLLAALVRG